MKDAICNAEQLEEELKELQAELQAISPSRKRQLERDGTVYRSRVRVVGPFVFDTIKKLNSRCAALMEQIDNFEDILLEQDGPERELEFKDFVQLVETVDRISVKIENQTEQIQEEVSSLSNLDCPYLSTDGSKEASLFARFEE